ncbi:hypothetical protein ACQKFS_08440 [Pseudomonas guineae]|uniref:hypothetical protein n=1 Tax=Pseudomonas guineae TaxID=425504 RepID=UPI003D0093C3
MEVLPRYAAAVNALGDFIFLLQLGIGIFGFNRISAFCADRKAVVLLLRYSFVPQLFSFLRVITEIPGERAAKRCPRIPQTFFFTYESVADFCFYLRKELRDLFLRIDLK